jgi:hypothetical protein
MQKYKIKIRFSISHLLSKKNSAFQDSSDSIRLLSPAACPEPLGSGGGEPFHAISTGIHLYKWIGDNTDHRWKQDPRTAFVRFLIGTEIKNILVLFLHLKAVNMSKKKRKHLKKWVKVQPDEEIKIGPVSLKRFGKNILIENMATPHQHAEMLKNMDKAHGEILKSLEGEILILQGLIQRYEALEIMNRAAYELLPLLMKYKSENDFPANEAYFISAVEYIQYLIARSPLPTSSETLTEERWRELWDQCIKVIRLTQSYLMTRKTSTNPPSVIDDLRFVVDSRRLMVRGEIYTYFQEEHLVSNLSPFEVWIKEDYGITVTELVHGILKIGMYLRYGISQRYGDWIESQEVLINKLIDKGLNPTPTATKEEQDRVREALNSEEFKAEYEDVGNMAKLALTTDVFDIY